MGKECNVVCGGNTTPMRNCEHPPLQLNTCGPNQNVFPHIRNVCRRLKVNIPDPFIDLIDIASYIYTADQAFPRGGKTDPGVGANWRRDFNFYISVRCPEIWSSAKVVSCLKDTLEFLSDDFYNFQFAKLTKNNILENYFDFGPGNDPFFNVDDIALFSGGLDSLAGAVQEIVLKKKRTALVSHCSTPKTESIQKVLINCSFALLK